MTNYASQLAAQRKIVNGTCFCGREFVGLKTKRYCSESCKQKAKRARKGK